MRILFLTQRLPYAPNRGDRVRAYHLIQRLRRSAEIDLVSFVHDDEEASHAGDLKGLVSTVEVVRVTKARNRIQGALALPTSRPLTHCLLDAPDIVPVLARIVARHTPDIVFAYCSGVARLAFEKPLESVPLVLDMVDVDSAKWASLAETAAFPKSWIYRREAKLLGRFEREAVKKARVTLITTESERQTLLELAPGAAVEVIENGVESKALQPIGPAAASNTVVFCGVMNYEPNETGALWMAHEVWPLVLERRPDARYQIVGAHPTRRLRSLTETQRSIEVTGAVPDVKPFLWNAAVAAAPLLVARGVQNKVLEAVAAGLPVVVTPAVMAGVPPEVAPACTIADGPKAFADALLRLLDQTPEARRAIANRADLSKLTWEERLRDVESLVRKAATAI